MGDMNAKIGMGCVEDIIENHGLGVRNARGDTLAEFCLEKQMVITNTYFKLPERRLYTWRSPADTPRRITRNQIDYICINKRYRNSVKWAKTYPGADVHSDHNLLAAKIKLRFKRTIKPQANPKRRIDRNKINNETIREEISEILEERLEPALEQQNNIEEL